MTRLQDDLLGVYNSLTDFSMNTLTNPTHLPIRVDYSESLNSLCFEQKGTKIAISVLNYYCENLKELKETYLFPEDYDHLMYSLSWVINSGHLLHDRVCLSPEKYGFKIYETSPASYKNGPQLLASVKFVSGNSWLFKRVTKYKYKNIL